jgi:hypothetical protein
MVVGIVASVIGAIRTIKGFNASIKDYCENLDNLKNSSKSIVDVAKSASSIISKICEVFDKMKPVIDQFTNSNLPFPKIKKIVHDVASNISSGCAWNQSFLSQLSDPNIAQAKLQGLLQKACSINLAIYNIINSIPIIKSI